MSSIFDCGFQVISFFIGHPSHEKFCRQYPHLLPAGDGRLASFGSVKLWPGRPKILEIHCGIKVNPEALSSCLTKISKIKNLSSIAFPSSKLNSVISDFFKNETRFKIGFFPCTTEHDDFLQWLWGQFITSPIIDTDSLKSHYEKCTKMTSVKNVDSIAKIDFMSWLELYINTTFFIDMKRMEVLYKEQKKSSTLLDASVNQSSVFELEPFKISKWPSGWEKFFSELLRDKDNDCLRKPLYIISSDSKKKNIWPTPDKMFTAFDMVSPSEIKVVIIGQDPYHTPGQATGLCFSTPRGKSLQPSLKNIFQELLSDGYTVNTKNSDLAMWARQGVFLINTALSVLEGEAGSHANIWADFTSTLFSYINLNVKKFVVVAWGRPAKNFADTCFKSRPVIYSTHPSPFSAFKPSKTTKAFIGSKPFTAVNKELEKLGLSQIDWNLGQK
jgi:uracil-DNA glycosylase